MWSSLKVTLLCALCSLCLAGPRTAGAQPAQVTRQARDTATVRLHISKMTCGSCPTTARLALKRLTGVYTATVTLDDSLGVVRYDPQQVTPAQIAAHLTRLTGFGATILPDTMKTSRSPGGE
jgi:copper chaperone CopZ